MRRADSVLAWKPHHLSVIKWKLVLIFLDEVVIFSTFFKNPPGQIRTLIWFLSKASVFLKLNKHSIFEDGTNNIGHLMQPGGLVICMKATDTVQQLANHILLLSWGPFSVSAASLSIHAYSCPGTFHHVPQPVDQPAFSSHRNETNWNKVVKSAYTALFVTTKTVTSESTRTLHTVHLCTCRAHQVVDTTRADQLSRRASKVLNQYINEAPRHAIECKERGLFGRLTGAFTIVLSGSVNT